MPKKLLNPDAPPGQPTAADIERVLTRTPGPDLKPGLEKALLIVSEIEQYKDGYLSPATCMAVCEQFRIRLEAALR